MASLSNRNLDTLPHVMAVASDPSPTVRQYVIHSIADDFRHEPQAIEHLLGFVDDEDEDVRWTLVFVVRENLQDEDIAIRILRSLCEDPSELVRSDARSVLARIEARQ